jgi:hypothetical protein
MMRHMRTNGDTSAASHSTQRGLGLRYSIRDAAKLLDLTEEAVRQRVKRGTLDSVKVGGSLFVLLDTDTSSDRSNDLKQPLTYEMGDTSRGSSNDTSRLVRNLEDEVANLRRQLDQANERDQENRRILAALTTRIPELPPTQEQDNPLDESGSPMSPSEGEGSGTAVSIEQEPLRQRSWLYRFFFGPN